MILGGLQPRPTGRHIATAQPLTCCPSSSPSPAWHSPYLAARSLTGEVRRLSPCKEPHGRSPRPPEASSLTPHCAPGSRTAPGEAPTASSLTGPAVPGDYFGPGPGGGARQTLLIRPGLAHLGRGQERLLWAAPGRGRAGPDTQIWRRPGPHSWGPGAAPVRLDKRLRGRRRPTSYPEEREASLPAARRAVSTGRWAPCRAVPPGVPLRGRRVGPPWAPPSP